MKTIEIDILKLYAGTLKGFEDSKAWNVWLTKCLNTHNINELIQVRKGLQMGMASAEKSKLLNEEMVNTWCRWIGSIDKNIRRIVKAKDRLQNDSTKTAGAGGLDEKRNRDIELEKFLRKESY